MTDEARAQLSATVAHSRHELDHEAGEHRLTEMELEGIRHALDAEGLAVKKCMHYAEECQDQDAEMLLRDMAAVHKRHWDQLLELLQTDGDPTKVARGILGL